jgi:hypothetical protein
MEEVELFHGGLLLSTERQAGGSAGRLAFLSSRLQLPALTSDTYFPTQEF